MRVLHASPGTFMQPYSSRLVWVAVLVLSPLAYVGSLYLAEKLPSRNTEISITRESAIQAATQFAQSQHVDTRGWPVGITSDKQKTMAVLLAHIRPPALMEVSAAAQVTVQMRNADSSRWFRTVMSPTGRVLGFRNHEPPGVHAVIDDATAVKIATSYLQSRLGPAAPFELADPKVSSLGKSKDTRRVVWHSPVPGAPQISVRFEIELDGDRVMAEDHEVIVEPAYLSGIRPAYRVYQFLLFVACLYLGVIGIYAIVRYFRRAFEKEVSHPRTILVAIIFVAFSIFAIFYEVAGSSVAVNGEPPTTGQRVFILAIVVVFFSILGAIIGMAYGAGEGDVRAAYPGKLTSLDALLSGKLFSANVARSILAGGAVAGAVLLLQNLLLLLLHAKRPGDDYDIVNIVVTPFPLGSVISDTAVNALTIAAFGLLVPVAFLRPRIRKEWIFYGLLPLFSMFCSALWAADGPAWRNFLPTTVLCAAATCIPFFFGDLLAAISSIVALDLVSKLIYRSAASEQWGEISRPVVYVGIAFLLVEIYFAWRGRIYEDDEVRPLYARLLAEHLAMQAEVGAARLAQIRLLPDSPPVITGLSIAGSCIPAREVGGDFYDFYALDDHRLGVFLAEGGNGELGSAMTIALAKGYLLYTARLDMSPVEVLRRLRDLLGSIMLGENASISMLYAVIDTRTSALRFARAGVSPRLVINGHAAVEEVALSRSGEMTIRHGAAVLRPNDAMVFYTDGLTAQVAEVRRQPVDRFLSKLMAKVGSTSAAELHAAILKGAMRRRNEHPADDVTAVVIRLEEVGEEAIEVVA